MHTQHEGKEEGVITMACTCGLFIMGKLIGGNKLCDPRVFQIIPDLDENEKPKLDRLGKPMSLFQLSPPPGIPPFILLKADGFTYPIPETEKKLLDLYYRVTHPVPVVEPTPIIATGIQESNVIKLH